MRHDLNLHFYWLLRPVVRAGGATFGDNEMVGRDAGRPKTILIVEDHELNMKLWNDVLEAQGYALLKTPFGLEAVEIASKSRPDLILLDIQLPDVSGFDVAQRLKADEVTRSIPIIALTAFAEKEHEREALASGCDGYISKPVNIIEFLRKIETYVAR